MKTRYHEPLYNEVLDITNGIPCSSNSEIYVIMYQNLNITNLEKANIFCVSRCCNVVSLIYTFSSANQEKMMDPWTGNDISPANRDMVHLLSQKSVFPSTQ